MAAAAGDAGAPPPAKRPRPSVVPRTVPPVDPKAEFPPAPEFQGRFVRGGTMTLRQVPFALRNDSGRVLRALRYDGFAILPGVVSPEKVQRVRKGTPEWTGTDALLAQTQNPEKAKKGTDDIKVIRNRDAGESSRTDLPERWETHWDWGGAKELVAVAQEALNKHAPELGKRWKRSSPRQSSVVLTRKFTAQQRWHMDISDWGEDDKKMGLDGEWLLVFVVLYGNKTSGSEGAGPDVCPFWPTKWIYGKAPPSEMVFTRPVLAPGDVVVVRSTMLHRGGGGMDRAVGFVPFRPMTEGYGSFGAPWLPGPNGVNIKEIRTPAPATEIRTQPQQQKPAPVEAP
eukprot:Hpha_TRINITY_DN187_c0_g1::TRINITY_DN187_c0_g1_i1::g.82320::m.82320